MSASQLPQPLRIAALVTASIATLMPLIVLAADTTPSGVLLGRLASRDPKMRLAAVRALGEVRPLERPTLEGIVRALRDPVDDVRNAARTTLQALSSVDGFSEAAAGLTESPRPIRTSGPTYPNEARKKKLEGTVNIELVVETDGQVTRARVVKSLPGLDDAALDCVRKWVFAPGIKDGRLVPILSIVPVRFSLYE